MRSDALSMGVTRLSFKKMMKYVKHWTFESSQLFMLLDVLDAHRGIAAHGNIDALEILGSHRETQLRMEASMSIEILVLRMSDASG
jgi:hypothetical protein